MKSKMEAETGRIVIYQSSTGFTKRYAKWIAEELNCRAVSVKDMAAEDIAGSDTVIFGGWIMGNGIVGYDKVKDKEVRNLIVFAVGMSPRSEEISKEIIKVNHLGETPFFYLPGGLQLDKLNFFIRFMLKQLRKSIVRKAEKSEQESYMERALGTNFDISDRKYIQELVAFAKK